MSKLTQERKEYLRDYQKTKLKRIPLEMSYDEHIALLQHIALYGRKKSVNGYIKESLSFVREIEENGLRDEVMQLINRKKIFRELGGNADGKNC
jgi:ribosomal 50S subunit-associated protein YjgA (DUF615 family)